MPGGARQFLILTLHGLESSSNPRATRARAFRVTSAHHQTVFRPPFMTASAPPLAFHDRQQRYPLAPRSLLPSAQTRGGCAALRTTAGHQPQSFGRHPNGERALEESRVIGRIKLLKHEVEHAAIQKKEAASGKFPIVPQPQNNEADMPHPDTSTHNLGSGFVRL